MILIVLAGRHRVIKTSPSLWKVVYFLDLENLGASKDQCASTSSRSMSDLDWKACYIEEDQKTRLVGPSSYRTWKAHSGRYYVHFVKNKMLIRSQHSAISLFHFCVRVKKLLLFHLGTRGWPTLHSSVGLFFLSLD